MQKLQVKVHRNLYNFTGKTRMRETYKGRDRLRQTNTETELPLFQSYIPFFNIYFILHVQLMRFCPHHYFSNELFFTEHLFSELLFSEPLSIELLSGTRFAWGPLNMLMEKRHSGKTWLQTAEITPTLGLRMHSAVLLQLAFIRKSNWNFPRG